MHSMNTVASQVHEEHVFENPCKLIKTVEDMKIWEKSEAYFEYIGFILAINEAVKGKSNSRGSEKCSEVIDKVVNLLDKLDQKIDDTPPIQQPQRFGNLAFRTWYQKMRDDSLVLLQDVLPDNLFKSIPEIVTYLVDSFGNSTRIDYGTGHEISFVMFLCCLFKIGSLKDSDKTATGCKIFPKYLDVARKLQQTYRMEPAGSHGVWSLDDYQFVPFIWGSSQLFANPVIEPAAFLQPNILNQYGDDYMFLTCIRYINSVKTGPFAEHSNQLWSISGVPSWSKINGGLIKMYKAEVLSKFPVVQHIVFGSLFTLKAVEQCTGLMSAKTSMIPPPVPFPKDARGSVVDREASARSLKRLGDSSGIAVEHVRTSSQIELSGDRSVHSGDKTVSGSSIQSGQKTPSKSSALSGEPEIRRSSVQSGGNSKHSSVRTSLSGSTEEPGKEPSGEIEPIRTSVGSGQQAPTPQSDDKTEKSQQKRDSGTPSQGGEQESDNFGQSATPNGENSEKQPESVRTSGQSGEKTVSLRTSLRFEKEAAPK